MIDAVFPAVLLADIRGSGLPAPMRKGTRRRGVAPEARGVEGEDPVLPLAGLETALLLVAWCASTAGGRSAAAGPAGKSFKLDVWFFRAVRLSWVPWPR